MAGDPNRRLRSVQVVALADIIAAVVSILYHAWTLIWVLIDPTRISNTGQSEGVVFFGLVLTITIHIAVLIVSWRLLSGTKIISTNTIITIKACKRWKNCSIFFLILFIAILLVLVLSSEKHVHNGINQLYMVYLLALISFTGYGIWYIGKFIDDIQLIFCEPENRVYFVPSPVLPRN